MSIIDIVLSEEQREGTKALVSQWLFQVGDSVEKNQPIVELETDKVMMEVIAPESGILSQINLQNGEEAIGSAVLGQIDSSAELKSPSSAQEQPVEPNNTNEPEINMPPKQMASQSHANSSTLLSPAVRRLIQQHNIEIRNIIGTGRNHRVTSRDIHAYLKNPQTSNATSSEKQNISNMRRSIANHMVDSLLHTAPHVTSVFNLDMSRMIQHRKENKQEFLDKGAKLTFTAYFIEACAHAIKQQPLVNSQWHDDFIEVFHHMNIGIGTALEDGGLIVPVLKNCENKTLFSIASGLTDITNKARDNQLKPQDVQGGTFTISNHGVSGSLLATPIIINQPQSAILGLGKMEKRVVVEEINGNDAMVIKPMCYVTLTIDHRVLDGQQTNSFLSSFVEFLENY